MQQTFATPEPIRMDVRIPAGTVEIEATATAETRVELTGPEELLERASVELEGGELRVRVREQRGFFLSFERDELHLRIRCPERSDLAVAARSADVRTTGRLAAVRAESASGDVTVDRADTVSLQSASGDVSVYEAAGELTAQTASGDVRVRSALRSVRAATVSGDIVLESAGGELVRAESVSGDVEVGIRRGCRVHVDAHTLSGDTHSDLDLGDAPAADADSPLVELRIQTVSGDISVVRAAAPSPQEV